MTRVYTLQRMGKIRHERQKFHAKAAQIPAKSDVVDDRTELEKVAG